MRRGKPGREFAWVVAEPPTRARWGYSFAGVDGGTEVTEVWELPPEGSAFLRESVRRQAAQEICMRSDAAKNGIGATLAAIKGAAEAGAACLTHAGSVGQFHAFGVTLHRGTGIRSMADESTPEPLAQSGTSNGWRRGRRTGVS